jgi:hypothetical protein
MTRLLRLPRRLRERDVLELLPIGQSVDELAEDLAVSRNTISALRAPPQRGPRDGPLITAKIAGMELTENSPRGAGPGRQTSPATLLVLRCDTRVANSCSSSESKFGLHHLHPCLLQLVRIHKSLRVFSSVALDL